ncbi:TPA: hypothetical protein ACLBAZ_001699, partial [Neisseria meningitidis]
MSGMAGRHPYGVRSGLRRNGLKLWDIHFRMTRFIVARCGLRPLQNSFPSRQPKPKHRFSA